MEVAAAIPGRSRASSTARSNPKKLAIFLLEVNGVSRLKFSNRVSPFAVQSFQYEIRWIRDAGFLHDLRRLHDVLPPFLLDFADKNYVNFVVVLRIAQLICGTHELGFLSSKTSSWLCHLAFHLRLRFSRADLAISTRHIFRCVRAFSSSKREKTHIKQQVINFNWLLYLACWPIMEPV